MSEMSFIQADGNNHRTAPMPPAQSPRKPRSKTGSVKAPRKTVARKTKSDEAEAKKKTARRPRTVKAKARNMKTEAEDAEAKAVAKNKEAPSGSDYIPPAGVVSLKELAKPLTGRCVKVLIDIAEDDDILPGVRMEAATRILDRAHGRPKEMNMGDDDDGRGNATAQEAINQMKKLREEIAGIEENS